MAIVLSADFKEFLKLLKDHEVEYLLVGGYAVAYHGYPRPTQDLDIWIAINQANADRMMLVLSEFGYDVTEIDKSLFFNKRTIIRMGYPPIRIEVLTDVSGVGFEECYPKRIETIINDVQVNIIDREHLIVNKRAAGRLKDLADVDELGGNVNL